MPAPPVVQDAMAVSSGTLASVTGMRRYDELDAVQFRFVLFTSNEVESARLAPDATWQEAWRRFTEGG